MVADFKALTFQFSTKLCKDTIFEFSTKTAIIFYTLLGTLLKCTNGFDNLIDTIYRVVVK